MSVFRCSIRDCKIYEKTGIYMQTLPGDVQVSLLTAEGLLESGTAIPRCNGKPENTRSTDKKPSECIIELIYDASQVMSKHAHPIHTEMEACMVFNMSMSCLTRNIQIPEQ